MTEQEALRLFRRMMAQVRAAKGQNKYVSLMMMIDDWDVEAADKAETALEKQIPQWVVESEDYEYDKVCPKCGHKPDPDDNYCANCGQALKIWEDEE